MEVCSILHLPEEVLRYIFSYLAILDRLTTALVCKLWLDTINCSIFLKDICVKITDKDFAINRWNFSRKFSYFLFSNIEIVCQHLEFFKEYGYNIKWLVFNNCQMRKELTESCYQQKICEKLHILEFRKCFFNIFSSLPELKELHLIHLNGSFICDRDVYELGKTMPNLEKFVLHHRVASRKVILIMLKWFDSPSELLLSYLSIFDFIEKRSRTLVSLDLFFVDFEVELLLKLLALEHLKLKRLSLSFSPDHNFTPEICQKQNILTCLHLCCPDLKDSSVKTICTLLPSLESLTIQGDPDIDSSIEDIFQLKNLRALVLNCCPHISESNFQKAVRVFKAHGLTKLDLSSENIDDGTLKDLLCLTPKLRYLSLASCRYVCDETVQVISKNLVFLRYLSLAGCSKITDRGICCLHDTERSIINIKGLQELNFLECSTITPDGLLTVVKFLELHTFHIDFINTDIEEKLKEQNPSLKYIMYDSVGLKFTIFNFKKLPSCDTGCVF